MTRTATVTVLRDGEQLETKLADVAYREEQGIFIARQEVPAPSGDSISLESAWASANGNLSLTIKHADVPQLTAMCRWDDVDPYFGVRLAAAASWLHVYLRRLP